MYDLDLNKLNRPNWQLQNTINDITYDTSAFIFMPGRAETLPFTPFKVTHNCGPLPVFTYKGLKGDRETPY